MCTPYLVSIISTYSIVISLFKDWRETQCAEHALAELLYMSRAGIGPQLCRSNSKHSPTSSVLLSWCSPRRGGEWIFSVWLAGAPSACSLPPVLDLLSSYEAEWNLCSLPPLLSSGTALSVFMWAADIFCILFNLSFCVGLFLSTCGASVEWRGGVHSSSAGGALMGGSAGSGWDWGCWTGGGRACLSWDSSSSSRGSIRPPSTASSAACWDWPMCRASPLCPTASTRWHTCCLSFTYTHTHTDMHVHIQHMHQQNLLYHVFAQLSRHICISCPVEHHSLSHRTHSTLISMTTMSNLTVHHVFLCWHCEIISVSVGLIVCTLAEWHNRCSSNSQ